MEKYLKKEKCSNYSIRFDSLCKFDFKKNNEIYKTFLTQEMLKKGILANNSVYVSIAHDKKQILDRYFCALEEVFAKIRYLERKNSLI